MRNILIYNDLFIRCPSKKGDKKGQKRTKIQLLIGRNWVRKSLSKSYRNSKLSGSIEPNVAKEG